MSNRRDRAADTGPTRSPLRRYGLPALLAVIGLLFVVQNTEEVSFDFFTFSFSFPLWVMLFLFAALGAFIGWWVRRRR